MESLLPEASVKEQLSALHHVPELDGLRGIAISLVVLFHLKTPWFSMGWCGVDLFFVLSGFLITSILLATKDSSHYFKIFYARRVLRIFPLYFAALFAFFCIGIPIAKHYGLARTVVVHDQIWFWFYLSNWRNAFGHNLYYLSHFWSLAVEEQYYLFWPLIVFLLSRRGLAVFSIAAVFGCLVLRIAFGLNGANPELLQRATVFRVDALAIGGLVALLTTSITPTDRVRGYFRAVALLGLAALAPVIAVSGTSQLALPMVTLGYTALALISAALVWRAGTNSGSSDYLCRLLRLDLLRKLGKHSYGMYVLHYPLVILVLEAEKRIASRYSGQWTAAVHFIVILVGFVGSYWAALVSWNLLEEPFLRLKDKIRYESNGIKAAPGTTPNSETILVVTP